MEAPLWRHYGGIGGTTMRFVNRPSHPLSEPIWTVKAMFCGPVSGSDGEWKRLLIQGIVIRGGQIFWPEDPTELWVLPKGL